MQEEAEKIMEHPAIRRAWDYFQTVVALVGEESTNA